MRYFLMLSLLLTALAAPAVVPATTDTTMAATTLPSIQNTHKKPGLFKRMLIRGVEKRLHKKLNQPIDSPGSGAAITGFVLSLIVLLSWLVFSSFGFFIILVLTVPALLFSALGLIVMKINHVHHPTARTLGILGVILSVCTILGFFLLLVAAFG